MSPSFLDLPNTLLCVLDLHGRFQEVSPSWSEILGFGPDELMGRNLTDLVHPEEEDRVSGELANLAQASRRSRFSARIRTRDGSYTTLYWGILSSPEEGRILASARETADTTASLPEAYRDNLTGLPNRQLLLNRIEHNLERAKRRPDFWFGVLHIGLDRFKVVNESLGHEMGDILLAGFAQTLENTVRPTDSVARMGGDEFSLMLEDITDVSSTLRVVERIQSRLSVPFQIGGHEVYTDLSIGIAVQEGQYDRGEQILRDANIAMHRAKEQGGGGYVVFDPAMHEEAVRRLRLELELRKAVEHGQFQALFQPVRELAGGRMDGLEALVRWNHPDWGLVSPGEFIPVAEGTGMIREIGRWMIRESTRQLALWKEEFGRVAPDWVAVNLSARQLGDDGLVTEVRDALDEAGLAPASLKLEITESAVMADTERAFRTLHALKELGVQLCLDDFGTGYSSLSYLHDLPVDHLKIDRSFVQGADLSERSGSFVDTIIQLSHNLDLGVIAEGIETPDQEATVRELGADWGQGFLYARPATPGDIRLLLARGSLTDE